MTLVEDVAARLRAHVTSRTVFEFAVPDGPLPTAYLLVRATPASERATRMADSTSVVSWTVRVLSVARHADSFKGARTADTGLSMARDALRDFRPVGQWPLRYETGVDAFRDESLPDTTFIAAAQYSLRNQL